MRFFAEAGLVFRFLSKPSSEILQIDCNMEQIQDGPLKLETSSVIKLFLSSNRSASRIKKPVSGSGTFTGSLQITNHGRSLVTFKIMSKHETKLRVRPSYGFIEEGRSTEVEVSVKNRLRKVNNELSILIIATTCKVIEDIKKTHLRPFWKNILHKNGSAAFVEVLEVTKFQFYDSDGIQLVPKANAKQSNLPLSDNNNNYEGASSGQHAVSDVEDVSGDSDASGDFSSQSSIMVNENDNEATLTTESIVKMTKLSKNMVKTHKSLRKVQICLLFFMFTVFFVFVNRNFRQIEFEILQYYDRTSKH